MTSHGLSSSCRRGDLTRCVGVMHRAERHRRLLHGDGRRTSVMSFQTALPLPVPLPSATVSCVPASMASQHCVCVCVRCIRLCKPRVKARRVRCFASPPPPSSRPPHAWDHKLPNIHHPFTQTPPQTRGDESLSGVERSCGPWHVFGVFSPSISCSVVDDWIASICLAICASIHHQHLHQHHTHLSTLLNPTRKGHGNGHNVHGSRVALLASLPTLFTHS